MNNTISETAQTILKNVMYSTIATTSEDGAPWAAPMFTVYDPDAKAIYWCAARNSQHGQNIKRTGMAFITIYDSMAAPGKGEGVYIRAKAGEVTDEKAISAAHAMLITKHQHVAYWELNDLQASSPIALYRADVQEAWFNQGREENGHFVLYRQPISL